MRFKRLISMTLAVSLTLGIFSGLPPLREATSVTEEVKAADGVHKAWNWGSRHEFVKYVKTNYAKTYKAKFNADGGHTFGNVNLAEPIEIPDSKDKDGKKSTTYRYWWFVTLDKYHKKHSHSYGENRRVNAYPTHKVGTGVWGTIQLVAKPKYDGSCDANSKKGFALDYIDIKGGSGKFKEDLGRTVGNYYGLSMYIIDLKDWMSNKGKYGYQKWSNTKENKVDNDTKKVTITMYLNAVTKTSAEGGGDNDYHARGLNTKEKWKNATKGWPISDNPKEYDQHYNIPVEIKFQVEEQDVPRGYYYLESRMAPSTNQYAKTFTNKKFAWGKNTGNIANRNKNGGFYKKVEGNVKGTSSIKITKDFLKKTGGSDKVLRGVRLERYAIDDPDEDGDGNIIRSSFTKSGYKYGDVAHVYLTCHKSELQEMFKDSKKKTTEHSYYTKNLESGSPKKNSVATLSKDHSVEVDKDGKAYTYTCEDGSTKKKTKTGKSKKKWVDQSYKDSDDDKKIDRINTAINAMGKGEEISYDQFLDYVSNLCFQYFKGENYQNNNKKPFQDHLVLIWERAVDPKLSMNTEVVSYDSGDSTTDEDSEDTDTDDSKANVGKYEGVTSGDHALNVPMSKMSDDYNVASTMDTLGDLVPSNNNLTLDDFLKKKIEGLIKTGDKHDKDYYYERLLYSTGDAVPAILSDIRVSYTDNSGTKIVKSKSAYLDELDKEKYNEIKWDPVDRSKDSVDAIWKEEVTKKNEKGETEVETKSHDINYYVWDGNNSTIENYLKRAKTLLTTSWNIEADLSKKMKITYVYVTPKTQTTQVNYVDVKNGDKPTKHFLFTDNENDRFSTKVKEGLSTAKPAEFDRTKAMQDSLTKTDLSSDTAGSGGKKDKGNTGVYEPTEFKALVNTGSESVRIPVSVQKIYGIYSFT